MITVVCYLPLSNLNQPLITWYNPFGDTFQLQVVDVHPFLSLPILDNFRQPCNSRQHHSYLLSDVLYDQPPWEYAQPPVTRNTCVDEYNHLYHMRILWGCEETLRLFLTKLEQLWSRLPISMSGRSSTQPPRPYLTSIVIVTSTAWQIWQQY